jgi:glyoxylase-like metal-dependent hydrolase (beta-lactamase superfamily II)
VARGKLTKLGVPLGDVIDLAGRAIDVLPIPGHDPASTAF